MTNPFAELAPVISPGVMQAYVIIMILLVIGGTLFDVWHKRSAEYFSELAERSKEEGTRTLNSSELTAIAIQTATVDVLTSAEFCNPDRRKAHLLKMYGFTLNILMTIILVFGYSQPGTAAPALVMLLWYLGALMVCVGGYWFWFKIRVDLASEGVKLFRFVRADLFILSLLGSMTFGLLWALFQSAGGGVLSGLFLGLYLISTTVLFGGVPWSKFAHMFFKPAAAYQKRVAKASGQAMNLPTQTRDDPEQQKRHSMELLVNAPMDMGLGIKREAPRHY